MLGAEKRSRRDYVAEIKTRKKTQRIEINGRNFGLRNFATLRSVQVEVADKKKLLGEF